MKNFGVNALQRYIAETGDKIICCEAEGSYTKIWFADGQQSLVPCNIRQIECFLKSSIFFRSHKSCLVNLNYIINVDIEKRKINLKGGHVALLCERKLTKFKILRANHDQKDVFKFFSTN